MVPPRDDVIHQLGREKLGISVRGHHGGPCASALQDFAPGPGTMAAHGRSIVVAKSWIAAASRPGLCGQLGAARPSRCGRRKYRQSPRSHALADAGESHLNLPLGLGFFVGAIEWGSSDRVGLERSSGARAIGWGSSDRVGLGQAIRSKSDRVGLERSSGARAIEWGSIQKDFWQTKLQTTLPLTELGNPLAGLRLLATSSLPLQPSRAAGSRARAGGGTLALRPPRL